jgi:WD40 repeat protein
VAEVKHVSHSNPKLFVCPEQRFRAMKYQILISLCAIGLLLTANTASPSQINALATQASTPGSPQANCKILSWIHQVEFSPDGKSVLAIWEPGTARMWDINTGAVIHTFGAKGNLYTGSATFSPNGKYVLVGEAGAATLWDAATGAKLRTFPRKVMDNTYSTHARFSPDGNYVVTEGYDGATLWDAQTGEELKYFKDPFNDFRWSKFSKDSKYLMTLTREDGVRLWDVRTYKLAFEVTSAFEGQLSPDGRYLFTTGEDGLKVWDLQTFTKTTSITDYGCIWDISPDGNYLLFFLETGHDLALYEVQTGKLLHAFVHENNSSDNAAFLPDSKSLLISEDVADTETSLHFVIWDIPTQRVVRKIVLDDELLGRKFSPDGKYLLMGSPTATVSMWDITTGKKIRQFC